MPEFHPLANAFPLLTGEPFDELVEDVKTNGVLEAVVMYEGKLLDGRNRWRAAQKLGLPHAEVKFEDLVKNRKAPEDPVAFVWSKNAVRRQLTPSQRAMAATKLTDTKVGANRHTTGGQTTVQQAADLAGVGVASVHRAKTVISKGTPEVVAAVESGKLAVTPAAQIAEKPAEIQRKIMENGAEEAAKTVAASKKTSPVSARPEGPGRGQVGPKVTMTRQMEGSSAEGSKARTVFWAENKELITGLDTELLGQFVKDLTAERRAIEQLLRLVKLECEGPGEAVTTTGTPKAAKAAPVKKTAAPRVRKPAAKKVAEVLPSAARKATADKAAKSTTENQETKK
jgi:ParB-like chromosome segregation protein Spo0J